MRDEDLYAFVADARARAAAGARRRTRWLAQQLREDASFDGLCRDLAASAASVEVALPGGHHCRGHLAGAGVDVLALVTADGATTYITAAAARAVRVVAQIGGGRDGPDERTDRPVLHAGQTFHDVLADLADRRDRVIIRTAAPDTYCGVLSGTGMDVVWFDDNPWHLRSDTITDVTVEGAP